MINNNEMFISIKDNLRLTPNLLLITTPMLVLGSLCLYWLITDFTWLKLAYFAAGYFFFNIIGITAGFHRYFSHKSFKVTKWKERLMMIAGTLAAQGPLIYWVALHRGYHHRHADGEQDPHSPVHGIMHSFVLWMYRLSPTAIGMKTSVDLLRNKEAMFVSKHYVQLVLCFWLLTAAISIEFFLFAVMLPTFITLLTYNITNCANHIQSLGYKNFTTRDSSVNAPWLWPFVLGECWHNNHHGRAGNYYFGQKWWEIDPAGLFIKVFRNAE